MTHRLLPSLPRIKVPIGRRPQKIRLSGFTNPRGRLYLLRQMVCRLMREERCEFKHNRAVECRAYMERLIQLALFRGQDDEYTMEMFSWWFVEQDMMDKMFDILVPRYRNYPIEEPYTNIYRLPSQTILSRETKPRPKYQYVEIGVLELKGSPYPSLEELEIHRKNSLVEFVKDKLKTQGDHKWNSLN